MNEPRADLKLAIRRSGLTAIETARRLGVKYYTFSSYLNGYAEMPSGLEKRLLELCRDRERQIINAEEKTAVQ